MLTFCQCDPWGQTSLTEWVNNTPFHRVWRVPGHWPESRFVISGHGPVSCLSCTDEFRPPSDKCSMSVRSNRRVPIKLNRPMTKVPTGLKFVIRLCSDEISRQWWFSNIPAPSLCDKLKCVQPQSNIIGLKWKIRIRTIFRPVTGLCGRGGISLKAFLGHGTSRPTWPP